MLSAVFGFKYHCLPEKYFTGSAAFCKAYINAVLFISVYQKRTAIITWLRFRERCTELSPVCNF